MNKKESHIFKSVTCSSVPDPSSWLRGHRAGLRKSCGWGWGWGFLDSCEEKSHQPSQSGPWGSYCEHTQEHTLLAIFTYGSMESVGKTHPLQRSQLLAPLFSALHTLPIPEGFFLKATQEGDGVWDLAQAILGGARKSQKLLPPRGLHFDCSLK